MALGDVITLGIGAPANVEHFITLGLEADVDVLLTGGDTGYDYAPSMASVASLVAPVPSAELLVLLAEPGGAEPSLAAVPATTEPALAAGPPAAASTYTYEP